MENIMYKLYIGIIISGLGGWALRNFYFFAREALKNRPTDAELVAVFVAAVKPSPEEFKHFITVFKGTWPDKGAKSERVQELI